MLITISDRNGNLVDNNSCFVIFTQDKTKTKDNDYFIDVDSNTKSKVVYYKLEDKDLVSGKLRKLGCKLFGLLKTFKEKKYTIRFETPNDGYLFNILEGIELSDYEFDKYFSNDDKKDKKNNIETITFVVDNQDEFKKKYENFCLIKENVFLCWRYV